MDCSPILGKGHSIRSGHATSPYRMGKVNRHAGQLQPPVSTSARTCLGLTRAGKRGHASLQGA